MTYDFGLGDVTVQAARYEQDLPANRLRGVPVDDLGHFLTRTRWNHNEPTDYLRYEGDVLQTLFNLQPLDSLTLSGGLRYTNSREDQQYHEPQGFFDSNGDGVFDSSIRQFRDQKRPPRTRRPAAPSPRPRARCSRAA